MIKIAIMGHGIVGSGVAEVLLQNASSIEKKAGVSIEIGKILDLREFPDTSYADRFTKSFEDIENDSSIKIVVEAMGGLNPAYDFVKRCLLAGKSVVSSNKELVAEKGDELLRIAIDNNLNFLFEASVGGGIPILRPLDQCLSANEVDIVSGILNGTTNFILDKMFNDNMSFEKSLKLAQSLGYAESDPSADVNGLDTCRKICILASLAFGYHVYPNDVKTDGITNITAEDILYAEHWGGVIKLIGHVKKIDDDNIDCFVAPMFVSKESLLSNIKGVYNGVYINGNAIGEVVFYGQGAGKLPTASAVVADIIDEVKHIHARKRLFWVGAKEHYVTDSNDIIDSFFVRIALDNGDKNVLINEINNQFHTVEFFEKEIVKGELGLIINGVSNNELAKKIKTIASKFNDLKMVSHFRIGDY